MTIPKAIRTNRSCQKLSAGEIGFVVEKNIAFVPRESLCTMCGTCDAVCPEDAVEMVYNSRNGLIEPSVDENRCTNCELCVQVCPGFALDLEGARPASQDSLEINRYFGAFMGIYRAYSTDEAIRQRGASGGVTTQILIYLLETGRVDGVIVTRMNSEHPLETLSYIAHNVDELEPSQKSKYCPTSLNGILKKVIRGQVAENRLAFVGLPAHVHGLRLLQKMYPYLSEKIPIILSLFTSHVPSRHATEFLIRANGVDHNNLARVDYRSEGHPGKMRFILKDGSSLYVNHLDWTYWGHAFIYYFYPVREWLYYDKTSEWADFSIGDNWQQIGKDHQGASTVITRSEDAERIFQEMVERGKVESNEMTAAELILDQELTKKRNIGIRFAVWSTLGRKVPIYNRTFDVRKRDFFKTLRFALLVMLAEHPVPYPVMHFIICWSYLVKSIGRFVRQSAKSAAKSVLLIFGFEQVLEWNRQRKIKRVE